MKEFRAFVDRIEGDQAVLLLGEEEAHEVILPAAYLPREAEEGSVLQVRILLDPELTAEATRDVSDIIRRLSQE